MRAGTMKIYPIIPGQVVLPLVALPVKAGFPSPADDYLEASLDLQKYLVDNPAATFMVRVDGDSMEGVGIFRGDLLIVDKSAEARDGSIVIAEVNGDFTLKRLCCRGGETKLVAENPKYPAITFTEGDQMSIWGVVCHVIKSF